MESVAPHGDGYSNVSAFTSAADTVCELRLSTDQPVGCRRIAADSTQLPCIDYDRVPMP
jgi:hypothetical protein